MGKICGNLLLLLLFITFLGCEENTQKKRELIDYIPENANTVFAISHWEAFNQDIENNPLFSSLRNNSSLSFLQDAPLLTYLHPKQKTLLCFNHINDSTQGFTILTQAHKGLFAADSIKDKTIETLKINDRDIQRITVNKKTAYSTIIDSIYIASSSQQIVMDILKGQVQKDDDFKKVYELPSNSEVAVFLRDNEIKVSDSIHLKLPMWTVLDLSISPDGFNANGITLSGQSTLNFLDVFKGQVPQNNELAAITPSNAKGVLSFTFNDAEKLQKEFIKYRKEDINTNPTGIFDSSSEIGFIELPNFSAVFISSIDPSTTQDALARYISIQEIFRDVEIRNFSEPKLFATTFSPLLDFATANYVFQLDNFFVFCPSLENAHQLIAAYQNNATLIHAPYYETFTSSLSSSSSLVLLKLQGDFSSALADFLNFSLKKDFTVNKYPVMGIQFTHDKNFSHVILSLKEVNDNLKNITSKVSEQFNLSLESPLLGNPEIIAEGNVIVQDIGNKLYCLSPNGKIIWTKDVGAPIIGKINKVDIFGNNKEQIAFSTRNSIFIIDRNGKDVNGFPIRFKDPITQPLAVFDYDHNHNYRFMVVQGNNIFLYDKNAKSVRGFSFTKTNSNIVQTPVHIRLNKKDYILIAEENGSLHILNRVGKTRVPVSKNFKFSEIPITSEDSDFVVITKDKSKARIGQDGKVTSQPLNVGGSYWFVINENTKATLDDNLLRIDGKLAELPLGIYSHPVIFKMQNKIFVTVTEVQANKVYLFDQDANLINGFPLYGTSQSSLSSTDGKSIALVTRGDSNSIIYYAISF